MSDWQYMELGDIVDALITRANQYARESKEETNTQEVRIATQADWDKFSS